MVRLSSAKRKNSLMHRSTKDELSASSGTCLHKARKAFVLRSSAKGGSFLKGPGISVRPDIKARSMVRSRRLQAITMRPISQRKSIDFGSCGKAESLIDEMPFQPKLGIVRRYHAQHQARPPELNFGANLQNTEIFHKSGCAMEPGSSTCEGNGNNRRFGGRHRCLHGSA
jgi:hypothetical protein